MIAITTAARKHHRSISGAINFDGVGAGGFSECGVKRLKAGDAAINVDTIAGWTDILQQAVSEQQCAALDIENHVCAAVAEGLVADDRVMNYERAG